MRVNVDDLKRPIGAVTSLVRQFGALLVILSSTFCPLHVGVLFLAKSSLRSRSLSVHEEGQGRSDKAHVVVVVSYS